MSLFELGTQVVNLRRSAYDVYIGRAGHGHDGRFGNPVRVGRPCPICGETHREVGSTLFCYDLYLTLRVTLDDTFREAVRGLAGKRLGCFCAPAPCHGDTLAEMADQLAEGVMGFTKEDGKYRFSYDNGAFGFALRAVSVLHDKTGRVFGFGPESRMRELKARLEALYERPVPAGLKDYSLDTPPELTVTTRDDWELDQLDTIARFRSLEAPAPRLLQVTVPERNAEVGVKVDPDGRVLDVGPLLRRFAPVGSSWSNGLREIRLRYPQAKVRTVRAYAKGPEESPLHIAVIGTAGRDKDPEIQRLMGYDLYVAMYRRALKEIDSMAEGRPVELVSGGAAWADHIAVSLLLNDEVAGLRLHLPAKWAGTRFSEDRKEGRTANYYHKRFAERMRADGHPHSSLNDLAKAIKDPRTTVIEYHDAPGSSFHARNATVAAEAEWILAFTWGTGRVPADGGTKHTWEQSTLPADRKRHVSLWNLSPSELSSD